MRDGIYKYLNTKINNSVKRSPYYPFPRDLGFETEKNLLAKWSTHKMNLVEIGVFEGASARVFRSRMHASGTLHLIDPYVPDSMNSALHARKWMARLNLATVRNGTVAWYEDYSFNVAKNWTQQIDFLFIDGDHAEEACMQDWVNWSPFVETDGVVVFHDARFGSSQGEYWDGWEGPTNVVNQLFRSNNRLNDWEIVDEAGTAVVVRKMV